MALAEFSRHRAAAPAPDPPGSPGRPGNRFVGLVTKVLMDGVRLAVDIVKATTVIVETRSHSNGSQDR